MTVSYLPTIDKALPLAHRIANEMAAYVVLCKRMEWGAVDTSKKQTDAMNNIRRAALQLANLLDLIPQDRERLERQLRAARDENEGLRATVARQRAKLEQLNAAVERQGVGA